VNGTFDEETAVPAKMQLNKRRKKLVWGKQQKGAKKKGHQGKKGTA